MRGTSTSRLGALRRAPTVISILIHSSKVHCVLQEDRADGGQVLLGGEMEGRLAMLRQLIHSGSCKKLCGLVT